MEDATQKTYSWDEAYDISRLASEYRNELHLLSQFPNDPVQQSCLESTIKNMAKYREIFEGLIAEGDQEVNSFLAKIACKYGFEVKAAPFCHPDSKP